MSHPKCDKTIVITQGMWKFLRKLAVNDESNYSILMKVLIQYSKTMHIDYRELINEISINKE